VTIRFEPVTLQSETDSEAMLAYRGDRLVAVLTHLSALHRETAGRWFLECAFAAEPRKHDFADLDEAGRALEAALRADAAPD
jgi:hypothetical protein